MPNFISENQIEQAILQKLRQFGFELLNCHTANSDDSNDRSKRADKRDVILQDRLREAAVRLNRAIPESAIEVALERLTDKRQAMSPVAANRAIDALIRHDTPQLFLTNAFCILSNAVETKVGSFTAGWEHFFNWLRVADEKEKVDREKIRQEGTSLESAVAGLCAPGTLLDYVENFIIYHKETQKIIAMNHQFMGVNRAFSVFQEREVRQGKLGVFWHTQGAGKSFSMIFYCRKIFRKLTGWKRLPGISSPTSRPGGIWAKGLSFRWTSSRLLKCTTRCRSFGRRKSRPCAVASGNPETILKYDGSKIGSITCAMWLTGFDAPTVSTLYLDKPMKDHTLMQAIARANRVTSFQINGVVKKNGEIIDYYNVFRNMKKALKEYAQGEEGLDEVPVRDKKELFRLLDDAVEQATAFCRDRKIEISRVLENRSVFKNIGLFNDYADILLGNDEWRRSFNVYENTLSSLYEACKPEILNRDTGRTVAVFQYLRGVIESIIDRQDIDAVSLRIAELLDESVVVDNPAELIAGQGKPSYQIVQTGKTWDLSRIDFEKLKAELVAVLLGSGTKGHDVMSVAGRIVRLVDDHHGRSDIADLQRLEGVGPAKAAVIVAVLEFVRRRIRPEGIKIKTPLDVLPLLRHYGDRKQEHFLCVSLNGANEIITTRVVSVGLVNKTQVHPREVFADPITDRASAVILAHNHPTGDLTPSKEDKLLTRQLSAAGETLGIGVLDHIIFHHKGYFSFLENGVLD